MVSKSDLLFYGKDLGKLIWACEDEVRKEVEGWERNKILAASEPDLVSYLVDKYTLDPPRLLRDQIYVESKGEAKIDVSADPLRDVRDRSRPCYIPGSYVTIAIPFEGEADLFEFHPATVSLNPPRGQVAGSAVLISFENVKLDPQQTRQAIDSTADRIEEYLKWIKNDCDGWNDRVQTVAEQCIRDRKSRLLEQANMVMSLGLPMKRRPDDTSSIAAPVVRKKRPVVLPPTPKEAFQPEPALPDSEYDYILTVIDRLSQSIERSPRTFVHMEENQIRDLILVNLNGHYEGNATGETFNAQGKTDILIRADEKNVFIAECKFWEGPKALHAAVDQILEYLTWRDTKAALILFSKNVCFTDVLASIATAVPQHPNYKREMKKVSDTHVRYLFRQKDDSARDLYLAVQAFNIPMSAKG